MNQRGFRVVTLVSAFFFATLLLLPVNPHKVWASDEKPNEMADNFGALIGAMEGCGYSMDEARSVALDLISKAVAKTEESAVSDFEISAAAATVYVATNENSNQLCANLVSNIREKSGTPLFDTIIDGIDSSN